MTGGSLLERSALVWAEQTGLDSAVVRKHTWSTTHDWDLGRDGTLPTEPLPFRNVWHTVTVYTLADCLEVRRRQDELDVP